MDPNIPVCFTTLIEDRKSWNLKKDVNLLSQLETFSQYLLSKTVGLLEEVETLDKDLSRARIDVHTILNNFEAVANNQFVENRVLDEDENILPSFDMKKNDIQELNDYNKEDTESALKECSKLLERKFEAVSISVSDSEEENDQCSSSETIWIPKNKYKLRPLPHLVGSAEFYADDSLGLFYKKAMDEWKGENIMNGDDSVSSSDSSSFDEPDDSSTALEYSPRKPFPTESNSLSDSKDTLESGNNSQENIWREQVSQKVFDSGLNNVDHISKESKDILEESPKNTLSSDKTSYVNNYDVTKKTEEINPPSSIRDELEQLFSGNKRPQKLAIESVDRSNGLNDTIGSSRKFDELPPMVPNSEVKNDSSPKKPLKLILENEYKSGKEEEEESQSTSKISSLEQPEKQENYNKNIQPIEKSTPAIKIVSNSSDVLPNIETEILPCFSKERAKIKSKRRLPSRRQKSYDNDIYKNKRSEDNKDLFKHNVPTNTVLSPSTDEEDLFILPQNHATKESLESSLFEKPSLFSPGSSIEESSKTFISGITEKPTPFKDTNNTFDEPLHVNKHLPQEKTSESNKNLFTDWDPFEADGPEIFPSLEKTNKKSKLFDDTPKKIEKTTNSREVKPAVKSRSLFDDDEDDEIRPDLIGTTSSSTKIQASGSKKKPSGLFNFDSDEDDFDDEQDIFKSSSHFKNLQSSKNKPNITSTSGITSKSSKIERKNVFSDPLSDPGDNLFD